MIEKANPKLWKSKSVGRPGRATPLYSRLKHAEVPLELLVIAEGFETCGIVDLGYCGCLRKRVHSARLSPHHRRKYIHSADNLNDLVCERVHILDLVV